MKRLVIGGAIAALVAGGAGASFAAGKGPGPNDHNNHGLCTAYFMGSETGQAHKHQAGPFVELENDAHEYEAANNGGQDNTNTNTAQEVVNFCAATGSPGGK